MSVFASQPSFVAPPSYSKTKIQPPPYTVPASTPVSFNPIKSITRILTSSSAATSTTSVALSTAKSTISSAATSASLTSAPFSPSAEEREQPSPSIPPPTYSPIKSAPKPLSSPPSYSANPGPRPGTGARSQSDKVIARGQVIHGQSQGLAFDYETEEWELLRDREERRRVDEMEASQREDVGCCAWWWSMGGSPLPWAAYYVF